MGDTICLVLPFYITLVTAVYVSFNVVVAVDTTIDIVLVTTSNVNVDVGVAVGTCEDIAVGDTSILRCCYFCYVFGFLLCYC